MNSEEKAYITGIVQTYSTKVYSFCVRLCQNKSDAEDLYQQVFLTLAENVHKIDRDANVLSYIYKICVLQYKNMKRKFARRARIAPTVYSDDENVPEVASDENIEKNYEKKEIESAVLDIVSLLDDKYKIPVILFYGREMSIEEIATVLHVPQGTVKSRLFNARKIIKEELEAKGFDGKEY